MRRPGKRGLAAVLLFAGGLCPRAVAGPIDPLDIPSAPVRGWYLSPEEVGRKSDLVVKGVVESVASVEIERNVWTDYAVRIEETWKGAWARPTLVVRRAGGRTATLATCCGPALRARPGEAWVFALARRDNGTFDVYGLTRGAFRISDGAGIRDHRGFVYEEPFPDGVGWLESIPLAELKRRMTGGSGRGDRDGDGLDRKGRREPPVLEESSAPGGVVPPPADPRPVPPDGSPVPTRERSDAGCVPVDTFPRDGGGMEACHGLLPWIAIVVLPVFIALVFRVFGRKPARRWAAAGAVILLLAAGSWAYIRSQWTPQGGSGNTGLYWDNVTPSPAAYFQGTRLEYHLITSGDFSIPSATYQWTIVNAFQTWEDSPEATIAFVRGADITNGDYTEFSIGFSNASDQTQWGSSMGSSTAGVSRFSWYVPSLRMADTDICFNRDISWSTDGSNYNDLESTVLHEIGHSLGFGHDPHLMAPMSYEGAWDGLNSNSIHDRRLTENDDIGLTLVYPPAGWVAARGTIAGSITEGSNNLHLGVIGVFDSGGRLVMTTLSNLGQYKVERLPPGDYTLRAFPSFDPYPADPYGLYQNINLPISGTPSDFTTNSTHDGAATVTANGTTTLNLTAASGTPAMRALYTTRHRGGGSYSFTRKGLRLQRGESGRIGVTGTGFPANTAEIAEFSIPGGGLTLSNPSVQVDWTGSGQNTILYDVSVAADAALGTRALILRRSTAPNDRYIVFGFIEIYEVGSLSAAAGPANPAAGYVAAGATDRVMLHASLAADSKEPVRIRQWTIQGAGTGPASSIASVRLYHDADGDGVVDVGETQIGSGAPSGSPPSLAIPSAWTVPPGTTQRFLVVYDLSGSAADGDSFSASLTALTATGVKSTRTLAPDTLPVAGALLTVDGSPPTGTVNDGATAGADIDSQVETTSIAANWPDFGDPHSGIASYAWAVGTTPGGEDIVPLTSVGLATSASATVSLAGGATYYTKVRAVNGAGLIATVVSDGVAIAATTVDVLLAEGYNLIALPLEPAVPLTAQGLAEAINADGGNCTRVLQYNGTGYDVHTVGSGSGFAILPGVGYFVRCTVASTWHAEGYRFRALTSGLSLADGYNLVGLPLDPVPSNRYTAESAAVEIASDGGACTRVLRYDGTGYEVHTVGSGTGFTLRTGEGYFLRCTKPSTWTVRR